MPELLEALAGTDLAQWMRASRWGYALVNTGHVFAITLLVGAILPLDLKLLGLWPKIPLMPVARILVPTAACGLGLAVTTGSLLFLADPLDYAEMRLFLLKISLITFGTLHALSFHAWAGWQATPCRLKVTGAFSLSIWLCTLVAGRMLAFTDS